MSSSHFYKKENIREDRDHTLGYRNHCQLFFLHKYINIYIISKMTIYMSILSATFVGLITYGGAG